MTGIIAAMEKELEFLKAHIEGLTVRTISGIDFFTGSISGRPVVAAVCGIGKVNAAICAQSMILTFAPDCIINTGVGGALNRELRLLDVVAASGAVQHDVDTTALGDAPGFVSTVNVIEFPTDKALTEGLLKSIQAIGVRGVSGLVATGDQFISQSADKQRISQSFGAVVCEMEGGSIAQVCYVNKTPCAILRAISDGADEGANLSYTAFAAKAAENSAKALLHFIAHS
ncbi:MAG: 5'-methylthioadenosine/adenosylhomocysteine nucleosidase [Clostridia bacterium]|nr:5'-methylthioadenosine/adenosylhomocysteine nucleosidase [Clostridia bacterium]